jgi:hypothetical protein
MSYLDGQQIAGNGDLNSSFLPFQLWAGDHPITTGNETYAMFGRLKPYTVMGRRADGKLVPWVPADVDTGGGVAAKGSVGLTGLPAVGDNFTIGGVEIVFIANGTAPVGNQVPIGATFAATAEALAAFIYDNQAEFSVIPDYTGAGVVPLIADAAGTAGNAITLAKSGANLTISGATLAGGSATAAEPAPESRICCVSATPMDTTAGDVQGAVYYSGCFNYQALAWPVEWVATATLAMMKAAMDATKLSCDALK